MDGLAIGRRRAGARRRRRRDRATIPTRAMVRSVANISGMSKSDPRARLMRTAEAACSAPAHSPTIAPTTASVTPTRRPPKMFGRAAGISSVVRIWRARRAEAAAELEQPRIDRADADHRRDRDREEDDQRADHDLAEQPRPEPQRRAAGRATRIGIGLRGDEVGRERARSTSCAAGQPVADDERRAPAPDDEARARISTIVVTKCGQIVPVEPGASTKRPATVSGAGRMNGGKPVTTTTIAFQTSTKTTNAPTTGSQPARSRRELRRGRRDRAAAAAGPRDAPSSRQVRADLARRRRHGGVVEVGDRPRPRRGRPRCRRRPGPVAAT